VAEEGKINDGIKLKREMRKSIKVMKMASKWQNPSEEGWRGGKINNETKRKRRNRNGGIGGYQLISLMKSVSSAKRRRKSLGVCDISGVWRRCVSSQ